MTRYSIEQPEAREAQSWGRFSTVTPATRWLADGQRMTLLEDLVYEDSHGYAWKAKTGLVIDGASIPRAFWTLVGSPFNGQYRLASIVHDYYCDNRHATWEATHRMFYQACRCAGESRIHAKVLFYAVWNFGPKWSPDGSRRAARVMEPSIAMAMQAERFIRENDPSTEAIETLPSELPKE